MTCAAEKLRAKVGKITAQNVLGLSDAELRACYFSRQKTVYVKCLAEAILEKKLNLEMLV